jgi:hypothetical protein
MKLVTTFAIAATEARDHVFQTSLLSLELSKPLLTTGEPAQAAHAWDA